MLRSRSAEDMAVAGMEEGEDSMAAVVVDSTVVVADSMVEAADFAEEEDSAAAVRSTAGRDVTGSAAGARSAATEDLAAGRIAEADLARADLAEDRSAADLDREALPERIEDLAADARAWDGVSGAWAVVSAGVSAGDSEMRDGLRMFREPLRIVGGMGSETAAR